jgi:nitric oxide reductase NorE protein
VASRAETASHLPGQGSMWFFVLGDLWIFVCYFACYVYDRGQSPEAFLQGQHLLSQPLGAFNTVILLTSSLFVALCIEAARAHDLLNAARFVALGGGCGALFMLIKAFEWTSKIRAGLPEGTEDFFLYYFMFTGLHVVHVSLGLFILWLVWRELGKREPRLALIESGGTYWHMVDLLWLAIFALVYLMR